MRCRGCGQPTNGTPYCPATKERCRSRWRRQNQRGPNWTSAWPEQRQRNFQTTIARRPLKQKAARPARKYWTEARQNAIRNRLKGKQAKICRACRGELLPSSNKTYCTRACAMADIIMMGARHCQKCGATISATRRICDECLKEKDRVDQRRRWFNEHQRFVICRICHKEFHPKIGSRKRSICYEKDCNRKARAEWNRRAKPESKRRRKARERGVVIEKFTRLEIFQRDGWRCHLCGKRCKRNVRLAHPLAPTLDHIIPLARGGDHTWVNVQTAHRSCNTRKNAQIKGQLRLM